MDWTSFAERLRSGNAQGLKEPCVKEEIPGGKTKAPGSCSSAGDLWVPQRITLVLD
jgi:hypothetical protein